MLKSMWFFMASVATGLSTKFTKGGCPELMRFGSLRGLLRLKRSDRRLAMEEKELTSDPVRDISTPPPRTRRCWNDTSEDHPSIYYARETTAGSCQSLAVSTASSSSTLSTLSAASDYGVQVTLHLLGGDSLDTASWIVMEQEPTDSESLECSADEDAQTRTGQFLTVDEGDICVRGVNNIPVSTSDGEDDECQPSLAKSSKLERGCRSIRRRGPVVVSMARRPGNAKARRRKSKEATEVKKVKKVSEGQRFDVMAATQHLWQVHRTACGQGFHLRHVSSYWLAFDDEGRCKLQSTRPASDDAFSMVFPKQRPNTLAFS